MATVFGIATHGSQVGSVSTLYQGDDFVKTLWSLASVCALLFFVMVVPASATAPEYATAVLLGERAVQEAGGMLGQDLQTGRVIVLTNAGYARPSGRSTLGCLDGLTQATSASVGGSTLIALQARNDSPLWFAFFSPQTGECVYLQAEGNVYPDTADTPAWAVRQQARIDADHIFEHPEEFTARGKKGLFGPNLFRIVTVANAAARNCPDHVLQAMRVHDHFCPGITSGVLIAEYISRQMLTGQDQKLFVLSLVPWCKEDALTTLLNATPGKGGYAVVYGDRKEAGNWPAPLNRTCTVAFTLDEEGIWTGRLLGFDFDAARKRYEDRVFGYPVLDKLYADLWFLDHLDEPESFVEELGQVALPKGTSPKDLVRPDSALLKRLVPMEK
jgi:formylmethanofuran dehydrogenase subunit E-like metal-binding protein